MSLHCNAGERALIAIKAIGIPVDIAQQHCTVVARIMNPKEWEDHVTKNEPMPSELCDVLSESLGVPSSYLRGTGSFNESGRCYCQDGPSHLFGHGQSYYGGQIQTELCSKMRISINALDHDELVARIRSSFIIPELATGEHLQRIIWGNRGLSILGCISLVHWMEGNTAASRPRKPFSTSLELLIPPRYKRGHLGTREIPEWIIAWRDETFSPQRQAGSRVERIVG